MCSRSAGLPNITAGFVSWNIDGPIYFTAIGTYEGFSGGSLWSGSPKGNAYLDASLTNSIYGNSTTVTPNSVAVGFYIKFN